MNDRHMRQGQRCIAAVALTLMFTDCIANQRIEPVVVTIADGLPCFSIPKKWETRNGIPFYGISVGELTSVDWNSVPVQYWRMALQPPGKSMLLSPRTCLRYGEKPADVEASRVTTKALEPYYIYAVQIGAHPEDSNVAGYTSEFCIKPGADGKMTAQVVPSNWHDPNRNAVCAKP